MQHHLAREGTLVAPVLSAAGPGYFYVCGDAKHMAKVRARLLRALRCIWQLGRSVYGLRHG